MRVSYTRSRLTLFAVLSWGAGADLGEWMRQNSGEGGGGFDVGAQFRLMMGEKDEDMFK